MKISISNDIDRINNLLAIDDLGSSMSPYSSIPFKILDINDIIIMIISDDDGQDVGLFVFEPLAYDGHFNVHGGFIKSGRGLKAYAGGLMMIDLAKSLADHGCMIGFTPMSKPAALKYALQIGFKLQAIIPDAIEIGTSKTSDTSRVDMAISAFNW